MNKQSGFTLVELIVVIVVLGILAATALPKFVNVSKEARVASVNGIAGALRSSVALVQAKYYASGATTSPVTMADGVTTVAVGTTPTTAGIPTGASAGIGNALQSLDGFSPDYTTATAVTFSPSNGGGSGCQATYNGSTGLVTVSTGNC
ncbi:MULTISPECIES: prepilin-type N-terminal cleavage/methylation domain-containing protein [unclassified Methylotenera]|uniref:prepilin-type N-terminal cleavage/methylation domain-containing protein n=1 Tax=unclassified Methylotenera TaxID=2643294 RepID=UPI0003724783|nr:MULTISPECIES: prepilin-type N-terminal cleavage/methylation domain-containing protein [unclassified Methylotenera]